MRFLAKLVNTSKLGGWVRAGVAALFGVAIAKWPDLKDYVDPATQAEIGAVASTIIVGVWSHAAKSIADKKAATPSPNPAVKVSQAAKHPIARSLLMVGLLMVAAIPLSACSTAQLTAFTAATNKYDQEIANFNTAIDEANKSTAVTNATIQRGCNTAITAGQDLVTFVKRSGSQTTPSKGLQTASTGLTTVTAAIQSYCVSAPADIGATITAITQAALDAQRAYQQAKAGA